MKIRLFFALALFASTATPTLQAAPKKPAKAPVAPTISIPFRKAKPPLALVRKLGGAKILRSGLAPLGPKRESCWVFWLWPKTTKDKKAEAIFAVWKPAGRNRWVKLGDWSVGTNTDYSETDLAWLNYKTRTGWVMKYYVQFEGTHLRTFPQGSKTPKNGVITSGPYDGSSTSISATFYEFGTDDDKRGFYSIAKTYSEPGRDEDNNTISINDRKAYLWNGKGWDVE